MNEFEQSIASITGGGLYSHGVDTIQANIGLRCNQCCAHCHLNGGPDRQETMDWWVMAMVVEAARRSNCAMVDITGGAPELNPNLRRFIAALRGAGAPVQLRTNLTALVDEDATLSAFLREHEVQLVGSMPCYLEENVRAQRGRGAYEKSVEALRRLNALGYGREPRLSLALVYNPGGPALPPSQAGLEQDYRRELAARFGIVFTRLLTITNMPLGRFGEALRRDGHEAAYFRLLREAFNPETVSGLMCRHQLSVGWNGRMYDCDFNLAQGLAVDHGAPDTIARFDLAALARRRIVTGRHCYGCTAGGGSSCGGSLV